MRIAKTTKRFRKDYAKLKKSGRRNMGKLKIIMEKLINDQTLEIIYRDHALQGQWGNFRDCHIEGDLVLIYKLEKDREGRDIVIFCATDNHANLF